MVQYLEGVLAFGWSSAIKSIRQWTTCARTTFISFIHIEPTTITPHFFILMRDLKRSKPHLIIAPQIEPPCSPLRSLPSGPRKAFHTEDDFRYIFRLRMSQRIYLALNAQVLQKFICRTLCQDGLHAKVKSDCPEQLLELLTLLMRPR